MTPTPQEYTVTQQDVTAPVTDGDTIVISGMSGLYPQSHHIKELSEILYNKVSPVSSENLRWKFNHPEVAQHAGNIPELERFDAQFFKVHYRLGNCMDPMSRKILEQSYDAIYDAGINPEQLSGQKVGVFIGTCFSESDKSCFYDLASESGFGITGCCRAMFANRVSYWLNAKGPSMTIDEACCSSAAALEQAYLAMKRGDCVGAVVGASCLCLHPQSSIHYRRIMKQSTDGKTRSFDANAEGTVKSEAINVLFLQKAKDALRIYADLVHVKTEFLGMIKKETGPVYGFIREQDVTVNFLKTFYNEAKVSPHAIEYVEAFGSAVPEADKVELDAIDKVFCVEKDDPLLVGSITSNIGYVEAATGIAGVTKVLLGYHTGKLAANLHYENPRQDIQAIREGRIKILTDHEACNRTYAAVNGVSVTGINSHILLHGHYKPKDLSRYKSNIPHLVTLSARQDITVQKIIDNLKSRPIDPEELALLHNIHLSNISGHLGRGFVILDTNEEQKTVSLAERVEYFDDARRPLWFVYSGMGSQWAGMGTQLMRIPIFAAAIERCRRALDPKGIDIVEIITSNNEKIFNNILHSFVGIAAIQIGLTDILHELGLIPDGIIGHSVGELGCAYADGCLTAEEMILSAYSRGLVSLQSPFIHGSMAAVGLGYKEISGMIPPEIEVACHNGPESSTISGPSDIVRQFVADITSKGIFAKEVPCSNIAYHSRYIAEAGPGLLKYLKEVIKTPKARSDRWVSTSVPKNRWNEHLAQYSSAEYHTNNLLCPVLFEETLPEVPHNAILVEVAPHGLLQAILKRSLPEQCKNIALTRRKHPDNTFLLLEAIGKLYMEGYNTNVQILYPKIEMPVSTGTPFLSNYVEWAHGEKWAMPLYQTAIRKIAAASDCMVSLHEQENQYLSGNVIEGKNEYPYAAALMAVWDTYSMSLNVPKKGLSVEFHDIKLYMQPLLHDQSQLAFKVEIQKGTGNFEVLDQNIKIISGCIVKSDTKKHKEQKEESKNTVMINGDKVLNADDIYDLLLERDYIYSGQFRSIERANASLDEAELIWCNNWVTLIDGMLQLNVLRQNHNFISKPIQIRKITIDIDKHKQCISSKIEDNTLLKAEVHELYDYTKCGGILIEGIRYKNIPASASKKLKFESLRFIQNDQTNMDIATSLLIFLQIIAENLNKHTIHVVGITDCSLEGSVFDVINRIGSSLFGINIQYHQLTLNTLEKSKLVHAADAVIVSNLSTDDKVTSWLYDMLKQDIFIITEEDKALSNRIRPSTLYRILSTHSDECHKCVLQLVRWRPTPFAPVSTAVTIRTSTDYALLSNARANMSSKHRLLVFSPYPAPAGLKDIVQAWRKESSRNLIQLVMVNNESSNLFIDELPEIDLAINVVNHCKWGGEYYLPIKENVTETNVMLKTSLVGDYDSLIWTEAPELIKDALTVNVHYAGISNTDIKKANGNIIFNKDDDNCFGMDFSGLTASGQRVMGIMPEGAITSQLRSQPDMLWPVPSHWSLEEAATVPLPYMFALYCLGLRSDIFREQSVLIHGGCGAMGQAAIAIALYLNCQVFTTVSDIRKKRFLLKMFPELKESHIGNSRDGSFADMVLRETNGEGCQFVFNNVKPELKDISRKCGGFLGYVFDLQHLHGEEMDELGMYCLNNAKSFATIDFYSIFKKENKEELKKLQAMMSDGIVRGYVRPLSHVTYEPSDVSRAFKLVAASHHRGRVLLRMDEDTPQVPRNRILCDSSFCQIILSDDEKFAVQLTHRLIERGAKKLHIHCKTFSTAMFQYKRQLLQKSGVDIQISSYNLNTENDIINLINSAKQLGAIQGIYSVIGKSQNVHESLFTGLDSTSRKLCPDLRYFAIINMGDSLSGHSTCTARINSKLPATLLSLKSYENVNNTTWREFLNATERALHIPETVIIARVIPEEKPTLLERISAIGGISLTSDLPLTATLEELGVSDEKLQSISTLLRTTHNLDFKEFQIPHLTLEDIVHLEQPDYALEDVKGLGKFFSQVDPDELQASTEMVFMPTITSGAFMRDNEFDMSQSFLCIVPGIEGLHERFRGICERLKLSALVLQPSLDNPNESIHDIAKRFTESLITKRAVKDNFYLLGYESGIFIALEMAKILEEHGFTGTVYCIGYGPDEVKKSIEETLAIYKTEEELQNALVQHMFSLMVDGDTGELNKSLHTASTWPQKIEVCMSFLKGRIPHSMQYAKALIESALTRIEQAKRYNITVQKLRSRLILLRAAIADPQSALTTSLQQYSQQPVIVHQLRAPLAHATKDARCAAIINQYLDSEILKSFENKNICDAYLLCPNNFMSIQYDY